jgi:hypothetical protein
VAAGRSPATPLLARAAGMAERARRSWLGQEVVRLAPALRPAWWVARGYLAVSALAYLQGNGASAFPVPELAGSSVVGVLAVLGAVALSVRLGQRALPRGGRLMVIGANAALAAFGVTLLGNAGATHVHFVESSRPPTAANRGCLATASGQPITNLYAYDAEGRLLDPVLLYDQDGQPIDNLCPDFDSRGRPLSTEYSRDSNGAPVINAFPRQQTAGAEPGGPFSGPAAPAVPVRPPAVVVPRLAPATTTTTTVGVAGG